MLSSVAAGRVLLVGLAASARAIDDALAALSGCSAALLQVDSVAAALAAAHDGAVALAILSVDAADAIAALGALVAPPYRLPVLVLAADTDFPVAACYQAGAADVLAASLAAVALAAKVARFVEPGRRQRARADSAHASQGGVGGEIGPAPAVASGLATWSWDIRRNRVEADTTMKFLFDVDDDSRSDLAGTPIAAYVRAIHGADIARAHADVGAALANGGAYRSAARVLARDGHYHHLVSHGEVLAGADGKPALLRGVVCDVTGARVAQLALDASEERYRTLFEAVDEGVCIIEMIRDAGGAAIDYRFLEVNQAFVRHTGLTDPVGQTMGAMVPGHDPVWTTLYGEIARSGEPARHRNDSIGVMQRWFDVYATRVGGEGSDRVAVLFTDVTESRQAQFELERLAADLLESNRRKNEFIATLAHELRNPLAPLRSGLPLLRLGGEDPAVRQRVLTTMERQLSHMVELVDDLLDVGRITHGQIALKLGEVDLAMVLAAAVDAARPTIEARGHRLQIDVDGAEKGGTAGTAALLVQGDATRLIQVLNNLLNNAARYTPEGGVVRLALRAEGGATALLEVSDNGVGIASADLAGVFDLFRQVGRDRLPGEGGLGIGLSLVRTLVELHGGSVAATSAGVGLGSTFSVRLPLTTATSAAPPPQPQPQPQPVLQPCLPAVLPVHAVRVLVVDDNSDAADILAELLDMLGHRAQVANSGRAALEAMQEFRPQVVLLDLGMPGMNGYQVAQAIRNDRRFDQPLLAALTGWGGVDDRAQTQAAGFDLHLTKPVDLALIEQVLARV
ncbi:hybrid sensor histidine kinase/response regulator [Massilia sp. PWRC2]|uniref:hybrid sensor histidine kinase/response regulator n=1 Tax=Massilia sp. PWRC2 TaxID=2804626 RepID=UPI003CFB5915